MMNDETNKEGETVKMKHSNEISTATNRTS